MATSTEEIEAAVKKLDKALKKALEHFKLPTNGSKEKLIERYKQQVLKTGAQNFLNKLKAADIKASCKALKMKVPSDEKEAATALIEKLSETGINALIESVDQELLAKFCDLLGLDTSEKDEMVKQIVDEVMLTGMETFLNLLGVATLKSHCVELGLSADGSKKDLVERLMVSIFSLEPLEDEDKSKSKSSKQSKKESSSEKKSSKKSSSKKSSASDEESSKKKSNSSPKKSTKKGATANKRTAWVAPPLETIRKGKYDSYTALYDNFNLPDLAKFCKQKGLVSSGKKKDVINRILAYLKTGVVEEPKKKGKKRKASSSGKKKPVSKKQKTSNTSEKESTKEKTTESEKKIKA